MDGIDHIYKCNHLILLHSKGLIILYCKSATKTAKFTGYFLNAIVFLYSHQFVCVSAR